MYVPSLVWLLGDDADVLQESNFQALLLANTIGPLGLALLSPVLGSLTGPFRISAADVGLLMSAFTAPSIIMIPLAGGLSDRYGRKPVLLTGLLVFGIAGVAIAFTTDFLVALTLRFVQGIGFAATTQIIITSIGDLYEGTREAAAQGFRFSGSGITSTVFPLIAGITVGMTWKYPFLLYAISFPIAGVVYVMLDEPTANSTAVKDNPVANNQSETKTQSLLNLLARRRVQVMVAVRGLPNTAYVGFLTYNSIIVVQFLEGKPAEAGVLAAVVSLSFAVAATQAGRLTAAFQSRLFPLIAANLALGVGFTVVLFVSELWMAIGGVVISGLGFGVTLSMYRSIITDLAPTSKRGSLVSVAEGFGRLTVTLTPILMSVVVTAIKPQYGFKIAVQSAVVGIVAIASGGSILGLLLVSNSGTLEYH